MNWRSRLKGEAAERHKTEVIQVSNQELKAEIAKEVPPAQKLEEVPAPAPFDERPIVKSVGLANVKGGWCVVGIKSQGNTIIDSEVISGPDPKPVALERLKIHIVRNLFLSGEVI